MEESSTVIKYCGCDTDYKSLHVQLVHRLGGGAHGQVYSGVCIQTGQEVAVKLEQVKVTGSHLRDENQIYRALSNADGVPRRLFYKEGRKYRVLAMELLGPSVEELLELCSGHFSLRTVLMLADQMLLRLHTLHLNHIIHGDVKPSNFLMGLGTDKVYITDYGLAQKVPCNISHGWKGTARFASVNAHLGRPGSYGDDLESLGYVILYLLGVSLPWQDITTSSSLGNKNVRILESKQNTSAEELCQGHPPEFVEYFLYCKKLPAGHSPDYDFLRGLFRSRLLKMKCEENFVYDWELIRLVRRI